MKRRSKIAITAAVIIVALPVLILVGAEIVLNSTGVKSEIENIVGEALEMEFKIEGRIDIRFFPLISLAANDVTVGIKTGPIASADQIVIDPRLAPLLNLDVEIEKAHLQHPRLTFNSQAIDKIMALINAASDGPLPVESLRIESFSISSGGFTYTDDQTLVDFNEMNFRGGRIDIIDNREAIIDDISGFFRAISFTGDITARQISSRHFDIENLNAKLISKNGLITADPIELEYFGEQTRLGLDWDLRKNIEIIQMRVEMPDLNVGRMLKRTDENDIFNGLLKLKGEFEARGADRREMVKNVSGSFIMQGTNLTLKGVDFDKALDEFGKMGAYGFNDFAALITLGPLGTVVSHGYDQLEALEKIMAAEGDSMIQQLVSDWKVKKGVAHASDVAFSTQRHRVAIAGSLDFPNTRYRNVTIAVVDANGCIVNKEIVDGPFENPEVEETGVIQRTVIRPLKKYLKPECEPFYDGSVPHPSPAQKK